ncbi:hypothetical protein FNO01nite_29440 [Flavobacterium noncentrifugens]|uniref:DUF6602 domain-containing protein n=1 Tax=Flavobacterium noncentrifugens TaxID=1128970 RepID=A0A1G8Y3F6_9FLAO|nr:DUF6602 domain-containing protein [Flavobacterium noncentrifugens]GEP52272.1 hypothetical protein FNO01nite_29440 [Flavobacterium noncentrifugens]SDJ96580.1 hypothetical protein SAMN04487935_2151 [Flavobacterium noncentrifugens]
MSNEIFEKILNRKIETFKSVFLEDSEGIFKVNGKLFHAQEFGVYRERVLSEIIKSVIPESIQVKDGFVITSKNKLSTQCDIILYDSENTPVINDGVLRFFPIESVLAICEVKSIIRTKAELKEILQKLAAQKKLDHDVISLRKEGEMITTFLVCKKIDFDFQTDFSDLYEGIENELRHNFILSLEDGIISYQIEREYFNEANKEAFDNVFKGKSKLCEYPVVRGDLMPNVITKATDKYPNIHIKMFLHAIGSSLEHVRKPRIELQNYYTDEL